MGTGRTNNRWGVPRPASRPPRGAASTTTTRQAAEVEDRGMADPRLPSPLSRYVLAWTLIVGGLVGLWCCRPWLSSRAFNIGQIAVLLVTWKIASLICLPGAAWARFTRLRLLAYCIWPGMQPRQFLVGQRVPAGAPVPTVRAF